MKILIVFLFVLLTACGKDSTGVKDNLASNGLIGKQADLHVQKPGVMGGATFTLVYGGQNLIVSASNQNVQTYLNALYNQVINVAPKLDASTYRSYRVVFEGVSGTGPCIGANPMYNCPTMNVSVIQAY